MLTLGILLLILGYVLGVGPLVTIGWILTAFGAVLLFVNALGRGPRLY